MAAVPACVLERTQRPVCRASDQRPCLTPGKSRRSTRFAQRLPTTDAHPVAEDIGLLPIEHRLVEIGLDREHATLTEWQQRTLQLLGIQRRRTRCRGQKLGGDVDAHNAPHNTIEY